MGSEGAGALASSPYSAKSRAMGDKSETVPLREETSGGQLFARLELYFTHT